MTESQTKSSFAEQLLAAETIDGSLRADYERTMKTMFERQLTMRRKIGFKLLTLFSIISGAGALTLAITEKLPNAARAALLLGAAFAAAWTVYLVRMLRRGKMLRRTDPPVAAGMAFVFSLMMCIVLAVGGVPTEQVLLIGMLFLIPAGLILIRTIVEQSELRTQEQLVRLEYKIAKLSERLGDDFGDAGAGVLR
jgi:hypothetical protein